MRYWSALALLRCVSSSPAAAAATLRSRSAADEAEAEDVNEVGRRTVLDQSDDDDTVALDFSPGSKTEEDLEGTRRRLLGFARRAEAIEPAADRKLQGAVREIQVAPEGWFSPGGFLPVHRHRGIRRAPLAESAPGGAGGSGHRSASARRAPGAHRIPR